VELGYAAPELLLRAALVRRWTGCTSSETSTGRARLAELRTVIPAGFFQEFEDLAQGV
jgi:hypothetical protein